MPDRRAAGGAGFVHRFGLRDDARTELARQVLEWVQEHEVRTVRLSFADQHGILRGKTLVARELASAMDEGVALTTTLLAKDTAHRTVFPVWSNEGVLGIAGMRGAADFLLVPDPATFHVLPWAPATAWLLCDIYFADGRPVPFSSRRVLADALDRLAGAGFGYRTGLEVEFHVFRTEDPRLAPRDAGQPGTPPDVSLVAQGFQYLTENRADQHQDVVELLRQPLEEMGLPLRTMEVEFGPSQFEFTFSPLSGMASADNMMLFRSAVKQICARHGLHATFMCRPVIENVFSSGWHLHQSLERLDDDENAFATAESGAVLSETGRHFLGGLLDHAREAMVFSTPTINGYKRYRPHSLAPDRIHWGIDNRGAMLRVVGTGAATRIENRVGEPGANPYLYLASQVLSGMDGIERRLDPGEPATTPYDAGADRLPANLMEACEALDTGGFFRRELGDVFVDYMLMIKRAEIDRYLNDVSAWEHREYFDLL